MNGAVQILQNHVNVGDPQITSDDHNRLSILSAIFEPLARRTAGGTYRGCIAESWDLSDDARTWEFKLRGGVTCHDGESLTATDVVNSLNRVREGNVGGELGTRGVFQRYLQESTLEVVDDRTIKVTTEEPTADLLDLLGDIPILSERAIGQLPEALIGTGPYQLKDRSKDRLALTAFPHHWSGAQIPKRLEWVSCPDPGDRLRAFLVGSADIVDDLPPSTPDESGGLPSMRLLAADTPVCTIFILNMIDGPCRLHEVRLALNYALDKERIIAEAMSRSARPLTGPLTPLHFGFNPETRGFTYDPERARKLVARAGLGPNLTVTLDVPTTLPDEAVTVARKMAEYYSRIGITTRVVEHSDREKYAEMVRTKQVGDGACFDSSPLSTFRVFYEKFHSGVRGPWWLGYNNPHVNGLIDQARETPEVIQRQRIYERAYDQVSQDAPWIFLYNPQRYIGVKSSLARWHITPEGLIGFANP